MSAIPTTDDSRPENTQVAISDASEIATLAGGLAHEIRNPLSTIGMNVELLREELADSETVRDRRMRDRVDRIKLECGQLEGILNAFLQFVRAGELELEATEFGPFIQEFLDFYQPQADDAGIELSPHIASNLPPVRIDRRLIKQALQNLIRNAQEAMPDGGVLEFQVFPEESSIVLEIIDNGIGIPEHARENIFSAFFSTKPGGSGLGLPTVRKIVEAHGGTIRCESEAGHGTRFRLTLPTQ